MLANIDFLGGVLSSSVDLPIAPFGTRLKT